MVLGTAFPADRIRHIYPRTIIPKRTSGPESDSWSLGFLSSGPSGLQGACKLQPGLPIKPMLAKAAEGVGEALRSLAAAGGSGGGSVLAEYKYDGQRAQIHLTETRQARGLVWLRPHIVQIITVMASARSSSSSSSKPSKPAAACFSSFADVTKSRIMSPMVHDHSIFRFTSSAATGRTRLVGLSYGT